jgi:transcription antitermination factor NusG
MNAESWYALRIRTRSEKLSCAVLEAKGYQVFFPTCARRCRQRDTEKEQQQALFPGYLFCRLMPNATGKMVTSPGVICVVGFGGQPVPVSDSEIESVRVLLTAGVAAQPWRYIPAGTQVQVRSGPLDGAQGLLLSGSNSRRLVVSITILQRSVAAVLSDDTLIEPLRRQFEPGCGHDLRGPCGRQHANSC